MSDEQRLRAAARYLRTYGWQQGRFGQHGGPRCMLGAWISVAALDQTPPTTLTDIAHDVVEFNDKHCETIDDACAAFEIAADLAA